MIGIAISVFLLSFGVFLYATKDPGFAKNKKFAWMFIAVGLLSLLFKIFF